MDADMVWWHIVSVAISSFTVNVLGWLSFLLMKYGQICTFAKKQMF
jgi:hypothetical protein